MTQHSEHQYPSSHQHKHGNPFLIPFILILIFAVVEFVGGIWTQSLALLGDAWHMFSDVTALGLAMLATYHASKAKALEQKSHAELIASVVNAIVMLIVIIWIVIEAIERLKSPKPVTGTYVMLIAVVGLVVNVIVAKQLHHRHHDHDEHESLNQRAALLHVMGDLLGSVAALFAGAVIYFTGWLPIDPILSIVISCLLLVVTLNLIKEIWQTVKSEHKHTGHHH